MDNIATDNRNFYEIVHTPATQIMEHNLDGVMSWTHNVVRGRLADDARRPVLDDGTVNGPHTFSSLEILEVYMGDLEVGDTITLAEPYFISDGTLFTYHNYLPSVPNQEYIFFLEDSITNPVHDVYYGIHFLSMGHRARFPIPVSLNENVAMHGLTARELSLGSDHNFEIYLSIWQEVIDTFLY